MLEVFNFHRYGIPREVMRDVFSYLGELPIKGGWGYTEEDAVIIDKNNPVVESGILFNGVLDEYTFIEHRNYLELITFRVERNRYAGIEYNKNGRNSNRMRSVSYIYDRISCEVTSFRKHDYDMLKNEWETARQTQDKNFSIDEHRKNCAALVVQSDREVWFEISSFYG